MSVIAINHCDLTSEIRGQMGSGDFQEAVMMRVGEIVENAQTGSKGTPHPLKGVELCAVAIAATVIDAGARMIANDLGVELDRLMELAQSEHISSC